MSNNQKILTKLTSGFLILLLVSCAQQAAVIDTVASSPSVATVAPLSQPSSVVFEPNLGQLDPSVQFTGKSAGYTLYLTGTDLVFDMVLQTPGGFANDFLATADKMSVPTAGQTATVVVTLIKANADPQAKGIDLFPGVSNYLFGSDPGQWAINVSRYAKLSYMDVYDGIDVLFYGMNYGVGEVVEHDFIVRPGVDPRIIKMGISGATDVSLDVSTGDLVVSLAGGARLLMKNPTVYYQDDPTKTPLTGFGYQFSEGAPNVVEFQIGAYDSSRYLVIDPVATLTASTYIGGSEDDITWGVETDSLGNVYTVGYTKSSTFVPTPSGTLQTSFGGGTFHAFVTKVNSAGTNLWTTYLGGDGNDLGNSIRIDSQGNIYIAGYTTSPVTNIPFPTTTGVIQRCLNADSTAYTSSTTKCSTYTAGYDAFVSKLNSTGTALTYSTYLGGTGFDRGAQLALDSVSANCTTAGQPCAILVGTTTSTDLATVSGLSTTGVVQTSNAGGGADAFVAHISATGVVTNSWMTYLGGSGRDLGASVALDNYGDVFVAGETQSSSDFPTTSGVISTTLSGSQDAFVTKLTPDLKLKVYSTYFGGSGKDGAAGIAVNGSGNAYVVGTTTSGSNYFNTNAFQASLSGVSDIYIVELNIGATGFNFSTYLGGVGDETTLGFQGIAVDAYGRIWVTGQTSSGSSFFNTNPVSGHGNLTGAISNAFLVQLDAPFTTAPASPFSTYLGGSSSGKSDIGIGVVLDSAGLNGYITGIAASSNFPTAGTPSSSSINNSANTTNVDGFVSTVTSSLSVAKDANGCPTPAGNCIRGYAIGGLQILVLSSSTAYTGTAPTAATVSTPVGYSLISGGGVDTPTSGNSQLLSQMYPNGTIWTAQTNDVTGFSTGNGNLNIYSVVASYNGAALTACTNAPTCSLPSGCNYCVVSSSPSTNSGVLSATATMATGFTVIGGGAAVTNPTDGQFLTSSYPSDSTHWVAESKAHGTNDFGAILTAYAIGIGNGFLASHGLAVNYNSITSGLSATPTATCTVPSGSVIIGGGSHSNYTGAGQLLVNSSPVGGSSTQWTSQAIQFGFTDSSESVTTYCIGISSSIPNGCPTDSTVSNCVRGYQVGGLEVLVIENHMMTLSAQPSINVSTPSTSYKISSVGALVDYESSGDFTGELLYQLFPDTSGTPTLATAASKQHFYNTTAYLTGYSVLIRYNGQVIPSGDYTVISSSSLAGTSTFSITLAMTAGYTLVGGGAKLTINGGTGQLLYENYPNGNSWVGSSASHDVAGSTTDTTSTFTVYAIGLKDTFLNSNHLSIHTSNVTDSSATGVHTVTCTLPTGSRLIGGGTKVNSGVPAVTSGQFLTRSYPSSSSEWTARSKDHGSNYATTLTSYCIGISSP